MASYLKMFLSVYSIMYTALFNRNLINFAVIIILIVSGNKLMLAVLFGTGEKANESSWFLPSREKCQVLLFDLPQDIHLHWICEFAFDTLNGLAWILPLTLCLINSKETNISDAEALWITVRKSCAGSSAVSLLPLGLWVPLIETLRMRWEIKIRTKWWNLIMTKAGMIISLSSKLSLHWEVFFPSICAQTINQF